MSYAYEQLRVAMLYLAQSGPLHERLAKALSESLTLRPKDLPMACRTEFCSLLSRLSICRTTKRNTELVMKIQAIGDHEAHAMAQTLINLYDTVTRYQPLPTSEKSDD
jgi:hypothetical protein